MNLNISFHRKINQSLRGFLIKMVNRFNIKTELKVLKALNVLFLEEKDLYSEEEILTKGYISKISSSQILLVEATSEESILILRRFISKSQDIPNNPKLDYNQGFLSGVKIALEYLAPAINLLKSSGEENILIYANKDYPITLENKYFKVIIAPRVETN